MTEQRRSRLAASPAVDDDAPAGAAFPPVMTVEQVAAYLQVGDRSVYKMAQDGEIPAVKLAGQWRFYKPEIDRWLARLSREHVGDATPVKATKGSYADGEV